MTDNTVYFWGLDTCDRRGERVALTAVLIYPVLFRDYLANYQCGKDCDVFLRLYVDDLFILGTVAHYTTLLLWQQT